MVQRHCRKAAVPGKAFGVFQNKVEAQIDMNFYESQRLKLSDDKAQIFKCIYIRQDYAILLILASSKEPISF